MWLCVDHYQSAGWVSGCTHTRTHSVLLYPAVLSVRLLWERMCHGGSTIVPAFPSYPPPPFPSPGVRTANKDILLPYLEAICGVRGDDE